LSTRPVKFKLEESLFGFRRIQRFSGRAKISLLSEPHGRLKHHHNTFKPSFRSLIDSIRYPHTPYDTIPYPTKPIMFLSANGSARQANEIARMHAAKKKAEMIKLGILNPDGTKKKASQAVSSSPSDKSTKQEWTRATKKTTPKTVVTSNNVKIAATTDAPSVCSDTSSLSGSFKCTQYNSSTIGEDSTSSTSGSRGDTSTTTKKKKPSSIMTEDFSNVFDVNKDEITRAQAKRDIRQAIDSLLLGSGDIRARMENALNVAKARGGSGSAQIAVVLSMRRFKRCEWELVHLKHQVQQLNDLSTSIQMGEIKTEGYRNKIETILQQKVLTDDTALPLDQELLAELEELRKGK